jgi:hypothetical protein
MRWECGRVGVVTIGDAAKEVAEDLDRQLGDLLVTGSSAGGGGNCTSVWETAAVPRAPFRPALSMMYAQRIVRLDEPIPDACSPHIEHSAYTDCLLIGLARFPL